ncbi:MAG: hypothetical protein AAF734_10355 [Bacteroidota bacterium]
MESLKVETVLKDAVVSCADETGWANLAEIGAVLRKNGVKYGKLWRFINDYPHIVETKIDTSTTPPAIYAKLTK